MDVETEKSIQEALRGTLEASPGWTASIGAHRLSTILLADRVVLGGGSAVEEGTHDELLRKPSAYRRLYESQFAA